MKSRCRRLPVTLSAAGLLLLAGSLAGADERVDRLPEEHRVWLEEEVVYIITEAEREVFLGVEGFEEREHFIEAFWQRRDPRAGNEGKRVQDRALRAARLRQSVSRAGCPQAGVADGPTGPLLDHPRQSRVSGSSSTAGTRS